MLPPIFQEHAGVARLPGEPSVAKHAHLFEPRLELRNGSEAGDLPDGRGVLIGVCLVVQHDVVAAGDGDEEGASRQGEKKGEVFQIILIRRHVIGVAAVAAHGDAGKFSHEVIF